MNMMILGVPMLAQQSEDQDSYKRCYALATTTHCFKTARHSGDRLQSFDDASDWCEARNYTLVKADSVQVQAAIKQFLEEVELTADDVWIAAKRETRGEWTWVNGEVFGNNNLLLPMPMQCYRPTSEADIVSDKR